MVSLDPQTVTNFLKFLTRRKCRIVIRPHFRLAALFLTHFQKLLPAACPALALFQKSNQFIHRRKIHYSDFQFPMRLAEFICDLLACLGIYVRFVFLRLPDSIDKFCKFYFHFFIDFLQHFLAESDLLPSVRHLPEILPKIINAELSIDFLDPLCEIEIIIKLRPFFFRFPDFS